MWTHGPELDLFAFTWTILAADLATGDVSPLARADEALGVEQLPSFAMWSAPVVAGEHVYHASVLPDEEGVLEWDDGSHWTAGLVSVPLAGGDLEVLAEHTRLVATDGDQVVHLADQALAGGAAGRYDIVEQRVGSEPVTLVSGALPERSSVTALALSEDLLTWVISREGEQDATLLALDRADGELRTVVLHDLLAHPQASGTRIGWGNWSGNGDPGEYLWDTAGPSVVNRLGENRGGSRVRVCEDLVAVTTSPEDTLVDTVVRLAD